MIVRLVRPVLPRADHLALYAPGVADIVEAPAELLRRMEGMSAYFHAERTDGGWDILERAEPPGWSPG